MWHAIACLSLGLSVLGSSATFNASSFLITMYADDPLSNGLDLSNALSASQLAGFTRYNSNSDITFGQYSTGMLVSGIQGSEKAVFADLGIERNIQGRSDCNTVGGGQNFASLHVSNRKVQIIDTCKSSNSCPQTFREIPGLMEQLQLVTDQASIRPEIGHLYLLRIVDDGATRAMFKILVVDVHPRNASVTFRYGIMDFDQADTIDCCNSLNENVCPPAPRNLALIQGPPGPRGSQASPSASPPLPDPSAAPEPGVSVGGVAAAAAVSTVASLGLAAAAVFFCFRQRRSGTFAVEPGTTLLKT